MIELNNITKIYSTKKRVPVKALDNINFKLDEKGLVFILGKSGSGKTTLLNLIGGLDKYDEGDILVKGNSTKDFSTKDFDTYRNTFIGFIFQEYNIFDEFTVGKNIEIALELQGVKSNQKQIDEILKQVDLEGYANRKPSELSTGQKQRIAIARALIKSPDIILADEPTGALDSNTGKQMIQLLKRLSNEKLVIVITHDRELAESYGDRIIEISDGKVIHDSKKEINTKTFKKEEINFKKSKFPLKSSFQMGTNSIKRKPFRLAFTIMLSVFAFTLFAVTDTISNYNQSKVILNSMEESNINYLSFSKDKTFNCDRDLCGATPKFKDVDIDMFTNKFSGYEFTPVFKQLNGSFGESIYDYFENLVNKNKWHYYEDSTKLNGGIELSQELIDNYKLELIAGSLPVNNDEIVLSKYTYNVFKRYGYRSSADTKIDIKSPEELIDKKIKIDKYDFTITGIIDTNFNEERYQPLLERRKNEMNYDFDARLIRYEFEYALKHGIHNLAFVSPGFYNDIAKSPEGLFKIYEGEEPLHINYEKVSDAYDEYIIAYNQFSTSLPQDVYWKDGVERSKLQENEIIIPLDHLPNNNENFDNIPYFEHLLRNTTEELIDNFAKEHFSEIKEEFEGYKDSYYYYNYILNEDTNQYHEGKDFNYFEQLATQKILDEVYFPLYQDISLNFDYERVIYDYPVSIVGFSYNLDSNTLPTVVLSESMFNVIEEHAEGDYISLLTALKGDHNKDIQLINFGEITWGSSNVGTDYPIINEVTVTIDYADRTLDKLSQMALYVATGLAIFASILLFNFLSASIAAKKKEIGILRALGARGKDIFIIFLNEGLIITLISFLIASITTFGLTLYFNNILRTDYQLLISLLSFGVRQLFLTLIISIAVALIGTFIPIYKFARKKPIDVIKSI